MDKLVLLLTTCLGLSALVAIRPTTGDQILPDTFCLYFTLLFRSQGCLDSETAFCKLMALKFTTDVRGRRFCDNFLCEPGYGQNSTDTSCTGVLSCPITKLRLDGVCPTNQVCCAR